jgi:peptidoglycan hydrolase-like protein with peptidoglycan-binding domain
MKGIFTHLLVAVCVATVAHADQMIQSVQQALKDQGLYYGNVTGTKSADTTAAIRRYQIRSGLQVTGEINSETLQSLNLNGKSSISAQPSSKPPVTQSNTARPDQSAPVEQNRSQQQQQPVTPDRQLQMNPSMPGFGYPSAPVRINKRMAVAEVQRQLITRGYYWGRVDGRYGRQTAFALREFQFASGLPPAGHIDMSTVEALGLRNANLAYFDPTHRYRGSGSRSQSSSTANGRNRTEPISNSMLTRIEATDTMSIHWNLTIATSRNLRLR